MRDVKTSAIGILFLSFVTLGMAQNPGGVPYPSLSSTDMGGDDSGSFGTGVFNFHPYRMFDQPGESWSMPTLGLDEVSAFVVFSSLEPTHVFELKRSSIITLVSDSVLISYDTISYQETDWHPKFLTYIESSPFGDFRLHDSTYLAFGSAESSLTGFQGGVAEVILYPYLLDTDQRNRVESYLSLKYGISLPDSSNYVRSDGDSIWIADEHLEYRHHMTGIGRDDEGGLYQKQSHNLYGGIDLTLGLESIEAYNDQNAAGIADYSYLLWADNDSLAAFVVLDPDTPDVKLMKRIWEANVIGGDIRTKTIQVRMDTTGIAGFDPFLDLMLIRQGDTETPLNLAACDFFIMSDDGNGYYSCTVTFDSDQSGSDLFGFYQQPPSTSRCTVEDIICTDRGISVEVLIQGDSDQLLHAELLESGQTIRSGFGRSGERIVFRDLRLGTYELMVVPDLGVSSRQTLYLDEAYCLKARSFDTSGMLTPNPVSSDQPFLFKYESNDVQDLIVSIYTRTGQLVGRQRLLCQENCQYSGQIDTSGIYFVKVEGSSGFLEVYTLVVVEE